MRERILRGDLLLGDGAFGTELQKRGLPVGTAPELWNVEKPDAVRQVSADYFKAGSDFVLTNTFGANRARLGASCLADQLHRVNTEAVRLARSAAPDDGYVLASVGPTGEELPDAQYAQIYAEQATALSKTGVDGFWVETVCSVLEGLSALKAIRSVSDRPVILTFTLLRQEGGLVTLAGENLSDAITRAEDAGADVVGVNCVGWDVVEEAAAHIVDATRLPIAVSPNAGAPDMIDGRMSYPESGIDLAGRMAQLIESGVQIVAGCCGTGPEYIATLRALIDRSK